MTDSATLETAAPTRAAHVPALAGKRAVDIIGSTLALILTLPVIVAAALLVLISDGRPVFFRQERVGRKGKPFTILKFRTMVRGAERMLDELEARNERHGPLFKMTHDPRVTRVGRFLRDSSIDELPQLLNVLRGDMSLVGPRPALARERAAFAAEFVRARERVRPGITGLWQIRAREEPDFQEYERLDRMYVETRTLRLDLAILLLTVPAVLLSAWRRLSSKRDAGVGVGVVRAPGSTPWHDTAWYRRSLVDSQPLAVSATYDNEGN